MSLPCHIRAFAPQDAEAVTRIYGHYVLNGTATFEETPPTPAVMGWYNSNASDKLTSVELALWVLSEITFIPSSRE